MEALLINPPTDPRSYGREGRCTASSPVPLFSLEPLSLLIPAAVLESEGHAVRVHDGVVDPSPPPDPSGSALVVVNASPASVAADRAFIASLRERAPGAAIVATGLVATARPEALLASGADACVRGEPEGAVLDIARALDAGRPLAGLRGVTARGSGGRVVAGPPRPPLELDALPAPARHLVDRGRYRFPFTGEGCATVLAARGCPNSCSFCTAQVLHGAAPRHRHPSLVAGEVASLRGTGVRRANLSADTFTHDRGFVRSVCEALRAEAQDARWACNARTGDVDEALARLMADGGCTHVTLGVESGSQRVLDAARKGCRVDDARRAARAFRDAGIEVAAYFVFGLPGETRRTAEATLRLALELDVPYAAFFVATPYPGTRLARELERAGVELPEDGPFDQQTALFGSGELGTAELESLVRRSYRAFYLRPRRLWRELGAVAGGARWGEAPRALAMLAWMGWGR